MVSPAAWLTPEPAAIASSVADVRETQYAVFEVRSDPVRAMERLLFMVTPPSLELSSVSDRRRSGPASRSLNSGAAVVRLSPEARPGRRASATVVKKRFKLAAHANASEKSQRDEKAGPRKARPASPGRVDLRGGQRPEDGTTKIILPKQGFCGYAVVSKRSFVWPRL